MSTTGSLSDNVVIVDAGFNAEAFRVTQTLWSDIDERYGDFAGNALISSFSFDGDWPTWEMHPAGDEFVVLLSGEAEMVLVLPDGDESRTLREPGDFVIVPKGIWHTARINTPTTMLFVTPGEGTENREEPVRATP